MDPKLEQMIYETGDNVPVVSDVVSGIIKSFISINKNSFAVVATTTTAISSTIDNQTMPFQ
jgi:hypothetical protein